jgi:hypothetical protein
MVGPCECECGCGSPAPLASQTDPKRGWVKGQPLRFVHGHNRRGKQNSVEHRAKISTSNLGRKGFDSGSSHPNWKGDQAGYEAIHIYLNDHFPKVGICDECKHPRRTHYALITGRSYSRNRDDYRELCSPCHGRYDSSARKGQSCP